MRNRGRAKVLAILALCVSAVGLTLGFAAFSNTLTISSSATVSPDREDFKITIYGQTDPDDENSFTSTTEGVHCTPSGLQPSVVALPAKIDNDNLTIKMNEVTINGLSGHARYMFLIVNEGKYPAYITQEDFPDQDTIKSGTVCTAIDENVNDDLLKSACENSGLWLELSDQNGGSMRSDISDSLVSYLELVPGEEALLDIFVGSPSGNSNEIYADGKYSIEFPDIQLKFSTVNSEG